MNLFPSKVNAILFRFVEGDGVVHFDGREPIDFFRGECWSGVGFLCRCLATFFLRGVFLFTSLKKCQYEKNEEESWEKKIFFRFPALGNRIGKNLHSIF